MSGSPTRYKNGVTNVGSTDPMRMLQVPDPSLMHLYFNDFDTYAAGDWTITAVGTGTSALSASIDGGALVITTSALENDGRQHQIPAASFTMEAGKKAMFKARFKVNDATQTDILLGLAVLDTTLLGAAAGDGATDGIFFQKDDGSTTLTAYCQKDTTTGQTSGTVGTLADDTFVTVAWYYDGKSAVECYLNGNKVTTLDASSTYLPDAALTVSMAILTGDASANVLTVDYILAAKERI